MSVLDIVIPVRAGTTNEHLRYALRSFAANLPHGRVWIVGARMPWLRNVEHIPTRQSGHKFANTTAAVRAACEHPKVSDRFILCNDDFFVMKATPEVVPLHRGPIIAVEQYYRRIRSGRYLRGMTETRRLIEKLGYPAPLSYELHVPLVVDKNVMLAALDIAAKHRLAVVHKRSLYGNLAAIGGTRLRDVKVLTRGGSYQRQGRYLSTMPDTFRSGMVGRQIRAAFPVASPYEARAGVRR